LNKEWGGLNIGAGNNVNIFSWVFSILGDGAFWIGLVAGALGYAALLRSNEIAEAKNSEKTIEDQTDPAKAHAGNWGNRSSRRRILGVDWDYAFLRVDVSGNVIDNSAFILAKASSMTHMCEL
jgi:hypothetical protein